MYESIPITETLYDKTYTATKLADGRYFIRIPIAYDSETKKYKYKTIYGKNTGEINKKKRLWVQGELAKQSAAIEATEKFSFFFEKWLYGYKADRVKDTTFDRYEQTYLCQIKPKLGDLTFRDVTAEDLQDLLKNALNRGLSYSSIVKTYRLLGAFYSRQIIINVIDINPMLKVEMYSKDDVARKQEKLREIRDSAKEKEQANMPLSDSEKKLLNSRLRISDQEEMRIFTDEEIAKIKDVARNGAYVTRLSRSKKPVQYGPFFVKQAIIFLFMMNTGLRAGEMLGLKYSDVNTESRTIGITKNVSTTYNRDEAYQKTGGRKTKTGTVKTKQSYQEFLEINSTALTILEELKREEPDGYDGFILHNGSKPLNHRSLVRKFHRLLKLADIETCGLHTLRHTFASKLYEQTNGDTKLVSEMLRHTSVSFTAETYIHLENKYKKKRLYDFAV